MDTRHNLWKGLFLIGLITFTIFSLSTLNASKTEVHVDVVNNMPYIDYTISFDSNFSINLPDFSNLVYAKVLPEDINYVITKGTLNVDGNKQGIIVFKYQSTPFLADIKAYKKTLDFDLIGKSKIVLSTDTKVVHATEGYTMDENNFVWNTDRNHFILYVALQKNPYDLKIILTVIVSVIIILILMYPKFKKKYFNKKPKNIYLNNTQKKILDLVKKEEGINQQELSDKLSIKKSNMSKILNKLERNEFIERKKIGKVNRIYLSKK